MGSIVNPFENVTPEFRHQEALIVLQTLLERLQPILGASHRFVVAFTAHRARCMNICVIEPVQPHLIGQIEKLLVDPVSREEQVLCGLFDNARQALTYVCQLVLDRQSAGGQEASSAHRWLSGQVELSMSSRHGAPESFLMSVQIHPSPGQAG